MTKHQVPADVVASSTVLPDKFQDLEGKSNIPHPTMLNTRIALKLLNVECSYDVFHDRRVVSGHVLGDEIGQVTDDVCRLLREQIRRQFKFDPGPNHIWDAINLACRMGSYHPVLDYLDGLKWDGKRRVETWLIDYAGAPDTPFIRAVSRIALVASVRRVRQPGCKFDFMTVLESGEGMNKSGALTLLYGEENFSDQSILGISDKELMENLRGRWGVEAADLSGIRKADVDRVKAQLSRQTDRGRPSYGRAVVDIPRTCVMWGSTNDSVYLRSQTGNRRFWPVPIKRFDLKRLAADRNQLWAEASEYESWGDSINLPEELWSAAAHEQAQRTRHDPWIDELAHVAEEAAREQRANTRETFYTCKEQDGEIEERITSRWLLGHLGITVAAQTVEHTHRLAGVMRKLGWDDHGGKTIWIGGATRGYRRVTRDLFA